MPFCIAALHPALLYFISACYSSLPLERNTLHLSTFNHKPLDFIQPSQLPRSFQAPSLFPSHANNMSCVCFSSSKPVWFFFVVVQISFWVVNLPDQKGEWGRQGLSVQWQPSGWKSDSLLIDFAFLLDIFAFWLPMPIESRSAEGSEGSRATGSTRLLQFFAFSNTLIKMERSKRKYRFQWKCVSDPVFSLI